MILEIFLMGFAFATICLFLGYSQRSFGFAYLGMFGFLLLGLFLMNSGLDIETGMAEFPVGSRTFVSTYENYNVQNEPVITLIANAFFYIPLAGILLTTFVALRE
jgi:hypothetical protein